MAAGGDPRYSAGQRRSAVRPHRGSRLRILRTRDGSFRCEAKSGPRGIVDAAGTKRSVGRSHQRPRSPASVARRERVPAAQRDFAATAARRTPDPRGRTLVSSTVHASTFPSCEDGGGTSTVYARRNRTCRFARIVGRCGPVWGRAEPVLALPCPSIRGDRVSPRSPFFIGRGEV